MAAGLALFGLVALVSIAGSVVPAWSGAIYGSWWFAILLGALALNTGFCTLRQIPTLAHGSLRTRVLFVVHASVLVLAAGCLWATLAFRSSTESGRVGDSFVAGGQTWNIDAIEVERYPDGSISDWVTTVSHDGTTHAIRVNVPLEVADDKVLQASYSRNYEVKLEADGHSETFVLPQDVETSLTTDGRIGFAVSPPRDGLIAAAQEEGELGRTVDLLLTSGGRILQKTAVFEGVPLELGEVGLTITVVRSVPLTTLLVRHTPGIPLVWTGLALLALSVTALMLIPRKSQEPSRA